MSGRSRQKMLERLKTSAKRAGLLVRWSAVQLKNVVARPGERLRTGPETQEPSESSGQSRRVEGPPEVATPPEAGSRSTSASRARGKVKGLKASAGDTARSTTKLLGQSREIVVEWGGRRISGGYELLSQGMTHSKKLGAAAGERILGNVVSGYQAVSKTPQTLGNHAAIFVNAILASDFARHMDSWLGGMFNEGIPSMYDTAVDAVYNATYEGGGKLHRLFDGSHTLWGMWEKVRGASPDDTLLQEVTGYATALVKDLSSSIGLPLFGLSKSSYDQVAGFLNSTFNIPRSWFADLLHVNATELVGASIGAIAVALNWNKKQVREFSSLAGSLGISSIASANPALAVLGLAVLAKSFADARQKKDYAEFVNGLATGGAGTGAFLAAASAVGGPVWVGLLAGTCAGVVVHKAMDTVDIYQINAFIEESLTRAVTYGGYPPPLDPLENRPPG